MKSNVLNIKNSDYEVTLKMICSLTSKTFLKTFSTHLKISAEIIDFRII